VSYYIIGQVSKFVPSGSKVIKSISPGNVPQVAFITPEGKKVLVIANEGNGTFNFSIKWKNTFASGQLPGGTVATYVW
jgi:glucosylceramidase